MAITEHVEFEKFNDAEVEEHLKRYIENRRAPTGEELTVASRYMMLPVGGCGAEVHNWPRAIVKNTRGTKERIYYRGTCWCLAK